MPYLTNLAEIARRTGFPVVEQPGWRSRGHGPMSAVRSVICHHDAARQSPTTFNTVIQNGHSTLSGPLSHFALRRDGTIHVVAAGLCYHAGSNNNPSLYSNQYAIGIEAGNSGTGEPWPRRQLDAYEALCAELCRAFGLPVSRVRGHKEIAPSRKIDPFGINMNSFRAAVQRRLSGGGSSAAPAAPTPAAPKPHTPLYYPEEPVMDMPKGGKHKPGGAETLAYKSVAIPSILREHDVVIAPGVGEDAGVWIESINTWNHQRENNVAANVKNPGGQGAIAKKVWVQRHAGKSFIVPKGVAKIDIAYASHTEWSLAISPR